MSTTRKSYPSDVTDGEWEFLLPYLSLMREDAPQREYPLRELFDALRYVVKTGCQWRFLPHDFPPWSAVYQQARRWVQAGVFETIAGDFDDLFHRCVVRGMRKIVCNVGGITERTADQPAALESLHFGTGPSDQRPVIKPFALGAGTARQTLPRACGDVREMIGDLRPPTVQGPIRCGGDGHTSPSPSCSQHRRNW